jgi:membrane associated rhomboid family serine protease
MPQPAEEVGGGNVFGVIPLGVEGSPQRVSVVGIGLVVTCLSLFALTWLAEPLPLGVDRAKTWTAAAYWRERPYLELPADLIARLPRRWVQEMAGVSEAFRQDSARPPQATIDAEQEQLDALCADAAIRLTLFRRLALTSEGGWAQPGWLTSMFLHAGWLHLLANLLLLYAVAVLLEDAWGRGLFLTWYLAGGVVAAFAQFLFSRAGGLLLVGASGAVWACVGATLARADPRPMRVGYLFFFRRGTVALPVWVLLALKVGFEGLELLAGTTQGAGVLAHLVSLGFGVGAAVVTRAAGLDRRLSETDQAAARKAAHRELRLGYGALASDDRRTARAHFERARFTDPSDPDAMAALLSLELEAGQRQAALKVFEPLVQTLLRHDRAGPAAEVVTRSMPPLLARDLSVGLALELASTLGPSFEPELTRSLWLRGGEAPGEEGALALVTATELALNAREVGAATTALRKVDPTNLSPQLVQRLQRAEERLLQLGAQLVREPPGQSAPKRPSLARKRQTLQVMVLSARTEGVTVQPQSGQVRVVTLAEVKGVAAGYVPTRDLRRVLVAFLVLDWGSASKPALMLRLDSDTGAVELLWPQASPGDAYLQFLTWVVQQSGATALPSADRLASGTLPFCVDVSTLEEALFSPLRAV